MRTSTIKLFAAATFVLFSQQMRAQLIISQLLTGSQVSAIELYNPTSVGSFTITSTNFRVILASDNKSANNVSWTNTTGSDIVVPPRGNIVIVGGGTSQAALISYLNSIGGVSNSTYFVDNALVVADKTAIRVDNNDDNALSIYDGIAVFQSTTSNWNKSGGNGFTTNDYNFERELEYLETYFTGAPVDFDNPNVGVNVSGFEAVYGIQGSPSGFAGVTPTNDDFEGIGLSPGNIQTDGTNWFTPSNVGGSSTIPTTSVHCIIETLENTTEDVPSTQSVQDVIVRNGSTLNLLAQNGAYAQAKRIKRRGASANGVVNVQRYFGNDGWHLIGTPFANGYANSQGRGASALYWYWNGSGWTEASSNPAGIPAGLGLMVRVGSAFSYSYTGGGAGSVSTGNGGAVDSYEAFTWDRTGSADGQLQYANDGHSSVSQGSGWNLLSNPFTCALDWNTLYDNGGTVNIDATVYIWNPTTSGWINYNAATDVGTGVDGGLIPPYGAFLVKVSADAPASISVEVDNHGTLTVPNSGYNKNTSYPTDVLQVVLKDVNSSATGMMLVSDYPQGTSSYDLGLDTWSKAPKGDAVPNIFQTDGNYGEIGQNLTNLNVAQSIYLGTDDLVSGNIYQIGVEQFVGGNPYHVSLEDTYLNSMIDLNSGAYTFVQPAEIIEDRFILHINQNTVSVEEMEVDSHFSYVLNDAIYLNAGDLNIHSVQVYSIDGKRIAQINSIPGNVIELCKPNTKGTYVLEIVADEGVFKEKVIF